MRHSPAGIPQGTKGIHREAHRNRHGEFRNFLFAG